MSQAIQCIVPENDVMVIAQHKGRQREHVEQVLYDPYVSIFHIICHHIVSKCIRYSYSSYKFKL